MLCEDLLIMYVDRVMREAPIREPGNGKKVFRRKLVEGEGVFLK